MSFSKRTVIGILSFSMVVISLLLFGSLFEAIKEESVVLAYTDFTTSGVEGVSFSDNSNDTTFLLQETKPNVSVVSKLKIDGIEKNVMGYKIEGSNYYSIRGIAEAMVNTTGRFKLFYDNNLKTIVVETGYNEPTKEEISFLAVTEVENFIKKVPTKISLNVNGTQIEVDGYYLNNNNYVNLKDLSNHLGYILNYNDTNDCIEINTSQSICSVIRDVVYNPQFTYDPFTKIELNLEDINKILAGTNLANFGQYFYNMQETYGVNVVYAMSVAYLESGAGKITCGSYNYFGMIGKNYSSPEEGINAFGKLMNNKMYYGKSIEQIAPIYCNSAWAGHIKSMMNSLWKKI